MLAFLFFSIFAYLLILSIATVTSSVSRPRAILGLRHPSCARDSILDDVQHLHGDGQCLSKTMSGSLLYKTLKLSSTGKQQGGTMFQGSSVTKRGVGQGKFKQTADQSKANAVQLSVRTMKKGGSTLPADKAKAEIASSIVEKGIFSGPARGINARTPTIQKAKSMSNIPQQYAPKAQPSLRKTQSSLGRISYSDKTNLEAAENMARKARTQYHKTKSEFDTNWQAQLNARLPRPLDLGGRQYLLQDTHKIITAKKAQMFALMRARTASLRANRPDRFARNNVKSLSALLTVGALQSQYQLKKDEIAKETNLDLLKHATEKFGPLHSRTDKRRGEHELSVIDVGASHQSKLLQVSGARARRKTGGRDTDSSDSDASSNRSI